MAIDQHQRGRAALPFAHLHVNEHEAVATILGHVAAGEISLLDIASNAKQCPRLAGGERPGHTVPSQELECVDEAADHMERDGGT